MINNGKKHFPQLSLSVWIESYRLLFLAGVKIAGGGNVNSGKYPEKLKGGWGMLGLYGVRAALLRN